eukprot:TRINITY_DN2188_c0_g1_i3.p1 TRINITY_DN2188_c0_g1~~TRINITY_DN2188_c0_g1_i3.p1  ORF type:complete len:286 (-),score=81.49 TRINITY_DN2188_c0_g1_i3:123-980(-)
MADDEYEHTLLIKKECFVYRIPPRTSAAGYKAQDWDASKFIWSGRLVITAKGDRCTIKLEDINTNDVFATCPVDPTAVEPVTDSSRYFVLKISDGSGRHAFIGMGFTERNDAFEFQAAIQDHLKHVKAAEESSAAAERLASGPKVDYSLKEGQTIHVNIGGKPRAPPKATGGVGLGGLAPPPPAGGVIRGHRTAPAASAAPMMMGSFAPAPTPSPAAAGGFGGGFGAFSAPAAPAAGGSEWSTFFAPSSGSFSPTQPPHHQQQQSSYSKPAAGFGGGSDNFDPFK